MLSILTTLTLAAAPQAVEPIGSLQRLDVPSDPTDVVVLDLSLGDERVEIVLRPHSVRAADFRLFTTRPDGSIVQVPAPAPNTWRGEVVGWEDTSVTASIDSEGLAMIVADYANDREWQVQPAAGYPVGTYAVARAHELPVPSGFCGVPDGINVDDSFSTANSSRGTGLQQCEVAIDTDFEFYTRNGNSVTGSLNDIERVMNRVDNIYVRDCDVTMQITAVLIRTSSNDPYTGNDAGNQLGQFRSEWNGSAYNGVRKDIAHIFSGKNVSGGVLGVAFVGVVCNQDANYGLSKSKFTNNLARRTALTAHEMGHNFNRNHCSGNDCRIMCPGLGGCTGDISRFGTAAGNGISNYAQSRGCLLDLSPPLALPIFDDFATTTVNRDLWTTRQGAQIVNTAVNEPSAPNSFRFDQAGNGPLQDDFVITNQILLGGLNSATVSFFTQHRGVPSGGALVVEIYDSNQDWQLLRRVVSDGVDQNSFEFHSIPVPSGAFHDEAQIRITAEVTGNNHAWYLDDFSVDDNSCGGVSNYCVAAANSISPSGAQIANSGTTSISANDFELVTFSCPPQSFGIYIYGDQQIQNPLVDGFLCVNGSPIYRLAVVQADLFGNSVYQVDFNNLPPGSVISAGDTLNFQLWYRDTSPNGANLSNGLEVNFCP